MKMLKFFWGLILFAALIVVAQLSDLPKDSPVAKYQRLPDAKIMSIAEAEVVAGRFESALLLLNYITDHHLPDMAQAAEARQQIFAHLAADTSPVSRLKATGWAADLAGGNSFESLAGNTLADAVLYGEIAELARQSSFEGERDEFIAGLNNIRPMTSVFPAADGALTLAKAAYRAGAMNASLTRQLRQMLTLIQPDPKSALAVEKFKENFMPMLELAKRCRTWGEFQIILQQAGSADQMKVLTKMVSTSPAAAKRLAQVLAVAGHTGPIAISACLDTIMRLGPKGLDTLYAAIGKGGAGLQFVADDPGFTPVAGKVPDAPLASLQEKYQSLREQYGAVVTAVKYLLIATLCGLCVLTVVPGRYLEKLLARPGGPVAAPGPVHYFLSALAVGVVLSGLVYLLSVAVRPITESAATATAGGEATTAVSGDSPLLSGTVVLVSLAIHAVVWFYARGKIRTVEDDETASAALRLKRLDNLDVFLDLPLFTGLALTVIAFILISLNAGMSRHFAYTSTVVGILSSVSLRIRYQYPLKERLTESNQP